MCEVTHNTTIAETQHKSDLKSTKDTGYLVLMGYEVSIVRVLEEIELIITAKQ